MRRRGTPLPPPAHPLPPSQIWPAGWAISTENMRDKGKCWPLTTEIDLYEVAGGFQGAPGGLGANANCASYHWGTSCFNDLGRFNTGCLTPAQLDSSGAFHTYGVEWTDERITWDVDGVVYFTMTAQSVPGVTLPVPDALELKINTAIAWWIDPPSRATEFPVGQDFTLHLVDWVRVYDRVKA